MPPPHTHTHTLHINKSELLAYTMAVSQNGKLSIVDWNNIWHASFFHVKIFMQSTFTCTIDLLKSCMFQMTLDVQLGFDTQ